ncbi:MAG: CoA transferase [Desulfobacteraceae bacterium]|nr:CoA transferase [Desulfobacteraceae bacterium]
MHRNDFGQSRADVTQDPQVNAREMLVEVDHPKAGPHKIVSTPAKFSRTPCRGDKAASELGANTEEILPNRVGLDQEEINRLKEAKII